jgi:diacylglycerol kinase family enzyme
MSKKVRPLASSQIRICCILNERAGRAEAGLPARVSSSFARHGLTPEFIHTGEAASISQLAQRAADGDYDIIISGGGDGTVNAVASKLVGSRTRLGILPLGTLNHFARDLKIPLELDAAVETIVTGRVKPVDVGEVNGEIFLNNSSVGLYPAVIRLREGLQRAGYGKWVALIRASIAMLVRFRVLRLELRSTSQPPLKCRTALLFVGNNNYDMTLTRLGTRAALDQGHLWVMMPAASGRWRLIATAFALVFIGERPTDVISFEAEAFVVSSRHRRLRVAADGEVVRLQSPLKYRIRPKSLLVIVPARRMAEPRPQRNKSVGNVRHNSRATNVCAALPSK